MCDPITSVEEDRDGDGDTFWNDDTDKDEKAQNPGADAYAQEKGYDTFWEYCCAEKARGCASSGKYWFVSLIRC